MLLFVRRRHASATKLGLVCYFKVLTRAESAEGLWLITRTLCAYWFFCFSLVFCYAGLSLLLGRLGRRKTKKKSSGDGYRQQQLAKHDGEIDGGKRWPNELTCILLFLTERRRCSDPAGTAVSLWRRVTAVIYGHFGTFRYTNRSAKSGGFLDCLSGTKWFHNSKRQMPEILQDIEGYTFAFVCLFYPSKRFFFFF